MQQKERKEMQQKEGNEIEQKEGKEMQQKERNETLENNKIWIVIAGYNEERKIVSVIQDVQQHGYENIVVVDDGSNDKTGEVAGNAGAIVLRHIINRGQGAALKTGMDFAIKNSADIIVTFDADGQHHADEISRLTSPIIKGDADVCLGSRFLSQQSNISWHRKLLLKAGAQIIWLFYGIHLTDSHNGFRALKREAAQMLQLKADRMEHASEIIEQIAKKKIRYKEIPVTITYTDYSLKKGQSSFAAVGIFWNMIKNKLVGK